MHLADAEAMGEDLVRHTARLPPERVIDEEHPVPGVLVPYRIVTEHRRRYIRFLAGAHDAEARRAGTSSAWSVPPRRGDLMVAVDRALYRAKAGGRDWIVESKPMSWATETSSRRS